MPDKVRFMSITDKVRYTHNTDFVYNGQKTLVPTVRYTQGLLYYTSGGDIQSLSLSLTVYLPTYLFINVLSFSQLCTLTHPPLI